MQWPARVVVGGRRKSAHRAYAHACLHIAPHHPTQPVSWWALCSLLSRHDLLHGAVRSEVELWSELFPFLLIVNERIAERAVEEYLVYLEDPRLSDLQWLGVEINRALERADAWNASIAALLEQPSLILRSRWMAILSYHTLVRLRRAVTVYRRNLVHAREESYWRTLPVFE